MPGEELIAAGLTGSTMGVTTAVTGLGNALVTLAEQLGGTTGKWIAFPLQLKDSAREANNLTSSLYKVSLYADDGRTSIAQLEKELARLSNTTRVSRTELASMAEWISESSTSSAVTAASLKDIGGAVEKAYGYNNAEKIREFVQLQMRVPTALEMARANLSTDAYEKYTTYLLEQVGVPASRMWETMYRSQHGTLDMSNKELLGNLIMTERWKNNLENSVARVGSAFRTLPPVVSDVFGVVAGYGAIRGVGQLLRVRAGVGAASRVGVGVGARAGLGGLGLGLPSIFGRRGAGAGEELGENFPSVVPVGGATGLLSKLGLTALIVGATVGSEIAAKRFTPEGTPGWAREFVRALAPIGIGAGVGALGGPWGMAAGAAVGLGTYMFGGEDRQRRGTPQGAIERFTDRELAVSTKIAEIESHGLAYRRDELKLSKEVLDARLVIGQSQTEYLQGQQNYISGLKTIVEGYEAVYNTLDEGQKKSLTGLKLSKDIEMSRVDIVKQQLALYGSLLTYHQAISDVSAADLQLYQTIGGYTADRLDLIRNQRKETEVQLSIQKDILAALVSQDSTEYKLAKAKETGLKQRLYELDLAEKVVAPYEKVANTIEMQRSNLSVVQKLLEVMHAPMTAMASITMRENQQILSNIKARDEEIRNLREIQRLHGLTTDQNKELNSLQTERNNLSKEYLGNIDHVRRSFFDMMQEQTIGLRGAAYAGESIMPSEAAKVGGGYYPFAPITGRVAMGKAESMYRMLPGLGDVYAGARTGREMAREVMKEGTPVVFVIKAEGSSLQIKGTVSNEIGEWF